jgi:RNA polymerase sigma factor (sigma-70 family)
MKAKMRQRRAYVEDELIVELYLMRNQEAIRESQLKFGRILMNISFCILESHEDSEECVNDTYLKAWVSIPPQKPENLCAYLGRIVRNLSINRLNAKRAQKRGGGLLAELTDCIPSCENPHESAQAALLRDAIVSWLYSLPQDDRVLFLRRYWYGDSLNELAYECGVTPKKLAGRMFRLRQSLKKALEREEISL